MAGSTPRPVRRAPSPDHSTTRRESPQDAPGVAVSADCLTSGAATPAGRGSLWGDPECTGDHVQVVTVGQRRRSNSRLRWLTKRRGGLASGPAQVVTRHVAATTHPTGIDETSLALSGHVALAAGVEDWDRPGGGRG